MVCHRQQLILKRAALKSVHLNAARGVAMLAVLAFLAVVVVLSTGFLNRQAPTMAVAANQVSHSQARMIAETGIDWLTVYLKETADDWRETRGEGAWIVDEPMYDGTLNIWVYDAEGDGDLTDDESESVQVIAIGESNGVKHEVRAIVEPRVVETIGQLLLVVGQSPLDSEDSSRKALFESWGWEVAVIDDNASTADFANAIAACDVIYIAYSTYSWNVADNLTPSISRGIVSEETHLNDAFQISSADWGKVSGNTINILTTSHDASKSLELGEQDLCISTNEMAYSNGTLAPGAIVLGRLQGRSDASFVAVDTGAELVDGSLSGGRRVSLPYGSQNMEFSKINDLGRQLIRDSLAWAIGGGADDALVAHWKLNSLSGGTALDSGSGDHDGVLIGSNDLNWESAVFQNGLAFPGEDTSYILVSEDEDFDLDAEGAVCMWVNTDAYGDGVGLLHKGDAGNGSDEAYGLMIDDNGRLRGVISSDSDQDTLIGDTTLLTSTWYHVALCWSSTGVRLYVNGELDASTTASIEARDTDGDVVIGAWATNAVSGLSHNMPFLGLLDDIRVYNRSLTDSEIDMLYENGATAGDAPTAIAEYDFEQPDPVLPVLVSHWRLDEIGSGSAGVGVYVGGDITLRNGSIITSYSSSAGAYEFATQTSAAGVVTNSTSNSSVYLDGSTIYGDVSVGETGDPDNVVDGRNGWSVTGDTSAQESDFEMPTFTASFTGSSSQLVDSTSWTIDEDADFTQLTMRNGATATVDGHVTLTIDGDMYLYGGGITIPDGSSLIIHVNGNVYITNNATVNADTQAADRLQVWVHGSSNSFNLQSNNQFAGQVFVEGDVNIQNQSWLAGCLYVGGELTLDSRNGIRVDTDLTPTSTNSTANSSDLAIDELEVQDGQMVNVIPGNTGQLNSAYQFDGSTSAVIVDHDSAYALDDATLSFWFYADSISGVQGLVSKDASGSGGGGHFEMALNDDLIVVQLDGLQDDIVLTSSTSIVADQWYHVGLVFNSRGAYLYIDGQLEDSDLSEWGLYAGSGGYGNSEPFVFGASSSSASSGTASPLSHYFEGMIDDVRLYDEAATINQIQQMMNDLPVTEEDSDVIPDLSGYGAALDLVVSDLDQINWVDGGLQIVSPVVIGASDASKLDDVLSVNDVFTVVLEFTLDSVDPNVPNCLFGYLNNASQVNTAFWLDDGESEAELTAADGYAPSAVADGAISTGSRTQVILTYDGEELKQYIEGELVASEDRSGGLAWQSNYGLYVGNVPGGGMPMQGTLYRLVIYDDAVNALQAQNIYLGRPPGSASGGSQLTYERVWIERF